MVRTMDKKWLVRASSEGDSINVMVFFAAVQKRKRKNYSEKEKEKKKKETKKQNKKNKKKKKKKKKRDKPPNGGSIDFNKVIFNCWETIHINRLILIPLAIPNPCCCEGSNVASSREGENNLVGKIYHGVIQVDDFHDTIFFFFGEKRFEKQKQKQKQNRERGQENILKPVFKAQNIMDAPFFSTGNFKFNFGDIITANLFRRLGDRVLQPNTEKKK